MVLSAGGVSVCVKNYSAGEALMPGVTIELWRDNLRIAAAVTQAKTGTALLPVDRADIYRARVIAPPGYSVRPSDAWRADGWSVGAFSVHGGTLFPTTHAELLTDPAFHRTTRISAALL